MADDALKLSCGCVLTDHETRLCSKHWAEFRKRYPEAFEKAGR